MNSNDHLATVNVTDTKEVLHAVSIESNLNVFGYLVIVTIVVFLILASIVGLGFMVYCCLDLLWLSKLPSDGAFALVDAGIEIGGVRQDNGTDMRKYQNFTQVKI